VGGLANWLWNGVEDGDVVLRYQIAQRGEGFLQRRY
jgi:hypothetical protein